VVFLPLKFFVKGMWSRLKKTGIFIAALMLMTGCTSENIRIPEQHMAPKDVKKGDSYIFLDSLKHGDDITRIGETEDGRNLVRVLFSTKGNDVEELNLYYEDNGLKKKGLESAGTYKGTEYYTAEIEIEGSQIEYFFEAIDGRVRYFVGETQGYSPKKIEKYSYEVGENEILDVPEWSKNTVWYGIYVDTFKNSSTDNDPIFNEMGPEYFFQPRGKMENGEYRSELVERGLWRSVDALGEFQVSNWTGDFSEEEAYEKNIMSKYSEGAGKNTRRYGGDIQGVQEKLSYLKNLGVEVVNLSPVFYSYSSHKKDVIDYRHISPDFAVMKTMDQSEYKLLDLNLNSGKNNLGEGLGSDSWKMTGSDKLMKEFTEEVHNKGMKVVLDVNLDYVSKRFWALKQALLEDRNSPYREWFYMSHNQDEKVEYDGTSVVGVTTEEDGRRYRNAWVEVPKDAGSEVTEEVYRWNLEHSGVKTLDNEGNMVAVNYENEDYRRYIKDALKKWAELGIDGYRLEVERVPRELISELEGELRGVSEDILLVKSWEKNSSIEESYFHSKDNYALGSIIVDYFDTKTKLSKENFESAFYIYSKLNTLESVFASPLYLDSKDTDRVFSMMVNPGRKYDSLNMPVNDYMNIRPDIADRGSVGRLKGVSLVQLTVAGAPYVYYGSEAGMWGADAPYSRKPMLWSGQENSMERDRYETYEAKGKLGLNGVNYNKVRRYVEYPVKRNDVISSHYKKVLEFRKKNSDIFKEGKLRFLEVIDEESGESLNDVLAYERILGEKRVIVVVNRGSKSHKIGVFTEGRGEFVSLMTEKEVKVAGKRIKVDIAPLEGAVYYN